MLKRGRPKGTKKTLAQRQAELEVSREFGIEATKNYKGNTNNLVIRKLSPDDLHNPGLLLIPKLLHVCKQLDCNLGELRKIIDKYVEES